MPTLQQLSDRLAASQATRPPLDDLITWRFGWDAESGGFRQTLLPVTIVLIIRKLRADPNLQIP